MCSSWLCWTCDLSCLLCTATLLFEFFNTSTWIHYYTTLSSATMTNTRTPILLHEYCFFKKKYFMNISYNNIAMHTHELVDPFQMPTKGEFETSSCCLLPLPLWRWGLQKKNMGGASCFSVVQGEQAHLTRTCREMTQNYVTSYRNWKKNTNNIQHKRFMKTVATEASDNHQECNHSRSCNLSSPKPSISSTLSPSR